MRLLLIAITLLISLSGCYVNLELPISRDQPLEERVLGGSGETKIALIELSGMMASNWISNVGSRRSSIDLDEVREQLVMAARDPAVRAVLLHINSPGGEVTTADVLFHELKQFRQRSGKPIVVSIGAIGASGGYYAALAGDEIWANPTSVVGSIGVVMVRFNAEGLLEIIGRRSPEIETRRSCRILGRCFVGCSNAHRCFECNRSSLPAAEFLSAIFVRKQCCRSQPCSCTRLTDAQFWISLSLATLSYPLLVLLNGFLPAQTKTNRAC